MRELDLPSRAFVATGFNIPAAKGSITWLSEDEVLVASDFGPDTLSASGYPLVVKRWRRGQPLADAAPVFTARASSTSASTSRLPATPEPVILVTEALDYWTHEVHELRGGALQRLALPPTARVRGAYAGGLLIWLTKPARVGDRTFPEGALVYASLAALRAGTPRYELITTAGERAAIEAVDVTRAGVVVTMLANVRSRLDLHQRQEDGRWTVRSVPVPADGTLSVTSADPDTDEVLVTYEDFLTPPTLYLVRGGGTDVAVVARQAPTFDASPFAATRHEAISADGTRVPYTVIGKKGLALDGTHPTNIFSYGGWRVSLVPSYSGSYEPLNGAYGSLWLARGGVYVVANIRGGGEFGPAWHGGV